MLHRLAQQTGISTLAVAVLTAVATLSTRYSLVFAGCAPDVIAAQTTLRLRWSVAAILATLVAVPALLALAFLVTRLPPPWRASLGFVLYLLSPVIALLIAAAFHGLMAPAPLPDSLNIPPAPGPFFVFLPVAFSFGALVLVGFRRSPSQRPA